MTALEYAINIIENYQHDIECAESNFGIDLVAKGFCQGSIYKYALATIKKLRDSEGPYITCPKCHGAKYTYTLHCEREICSKCTGDGYVLKKLL